METDIEDIRKNYEKLDNERIIRLASEEADGLRPEALDLLKQIIRERGLPSKVSKALEVQVEIMDEKTLIGYCELLRNLPCPQCNAVREKLNANVIAQVSGGMYFPETKVACPNCLDKTYVSANTHAAWFGWRSIFGIINVPRALLFNRRMKKFNHIPEASDPLKEFVLKRAGRIELYRNDQEGLSDILLFPRGD